MSRKPLGIAGGVGVILGLIGTGIQLRWPEQKWLGTAFLIAAGLVTFALIIWILARWHTQREVELPETEKTNSVTQTMSGSPQGRQVGGNLTNKGNDDSRLRTDEDHN